MLLSSLQRMAGSVGKTASVGECSHGKNNVFGSGRRHSKQRCSTLP